jgi:hypothetical protein
MKEDVFGGFVQEFPFLSSILQSMPGGRSPAAGIDSVSVRLVDENLLAVTPFHVHCCDDPRLGDYLRERVFWCFEEGNRVRKMAILGRSKIEGPGETYTTASSIGAQLLVQNAEITYLVEVSYECTPKHARTEKACQRRVIVYKMADFDWRTSCRYMLLDAA